MKNKAVDNKQILEESPNPKKIKIMGRKSTLGKEYPKYRKGEKYLSTFCFLPQTNPTGKEISKAIITLIIKR